LLLEIPPVFFIHQNQIEVILHAELIVDVSVGWGHIIRAQEQPDWNRLPCTTVTNVGHNARLSIKNMRTQNHLLTFTTMKVARKHERYSAKKSEELVKQDCSGEFYEETHHEQEHHP